MPTPLVVQANKEKYEEIYRKGYDKKHPSTDLVRLERWYFQGKPGRLLEYGFGVGANLLYLLECGYEVDGIEASGEALKITRNKLKARPQLESRAHLGLIGPEDTALPYGAGTFDYVVCVSVLSLLGTRERVAQSLSEFRRVMKPGAKMILDLNGPDSDFSRRARLVGEDVYERLGSSGEEAPRLYFCPQTEERFRSLLSGFQVDDVGHTSFRYLGNQSFEYTACVQKTG